MRAASYGFARPPGGGWLGFMTGWYSLDVVLLAVCAVALAFLGYVAVAL